MDEWYRKTADRAADALIELGLSWPGVTFPTPATELPDDPTRVLAWCEYARTEERSDPARFVLGGLRSGEWPPPRGGRS